MNGQNVSISYKLQLGCKYGTSLGICGCCQVRVVKYYDAQLTFVQMNPTVKACNKGPGEECGGIWNMGGTCGAGLRFKL